MSLKLKRGRVVSISVNANTSSKHVTAPAGIIWSQRTQSSDEVTEQFQAL
jgi:hypothetical protein